MQGIAPSGFKYAQATRGGRLHIAPITDEHGNVAEYALCGLWPEQRMTCIWRRTFVGTPEFAEGGFICGRCAHIADLRGLE